jgi:hypothetical protein
MSFLFTTGYLSVKFHKLMDKSTQYLAIQVPKSDDECFNITVDNNVYAMSGLDFHLVCRDDETLPYLAIGLSIALLLVLCMPSPTSVSPSDKKEPEVKSMEQLGILKILQSCGLGVIRRQTRHTNQNQASS